MGARMERFAPDATTNPLFTVYQTADGWIAIAAIQSSHWPLIARGVGRADLLDDERFAKFGSVIANREEFRALFVPHMRTQTTAHWWRELRAVGAWVAPVNRLEDLARDENILANDYLTTFDDGFVGPPAPFEVDGFQGVRGLAAAYGEHSDAILAELGYTEEEIIDLHVKEAVW